MEKVKTAVKIGFKNTEEGWKMIDDFDIEQMAQENAELKARIADMGKGYQVLKKGKTELENEIENLKAQILNLEKQFYKESGKSGAYEFVLSKMFGSGKE